MEDKRFLLEEDANNEVSYLKSSKCWNLSTYNGLIYSDLESEKRSFRSRTPSEQLLRLAAYYNVYRRYFEKVKPDFALVSQVEGVTGKVFCAVAREKKVKLIVPFSGRNLGGFYFAEDEIERLPRYSSSIKLDQIKAKKFVENFRETPSAAVVSSPFLNGDKFVGNHMGIIDRLKHHFIRIVKYRNLYEVDNIRVGILRNFTLLDRAIQKFRTSRNVKFTDIKLLEELPAKFVYFPIQYTPESSINSPAPYFVDQLRAIDLIRLNLPSEYTLVIKEHPACIGKRDLNFYKQVRGRPGIFVASHRLPSVEIVKKAGLTISVTGTSVLEAFLLGSSSFALSSILCSEFLPKENSIFSKNAIHALINTKPNNTAVYDAVARIQACLYDIEYVTPDGKKNVLSEKNIRNILSALDDHIQKVSGYAADG